LLLEEDWIMYFGEEVKQVEVWRLYICKAEKCIAGKNELDSSCEGCKYCSIAYFTTKPIVEKVKLTIRESCYKTHKENKCRVGKEKFDNDSVCKSCYRYSRNIVKVEKV